MDIKKEREEFELSFKETDFYKMNLVNCFCFIADRYVWDEVQAAWEMWQTAIARMKVQINTLDEMLLNQGEALAQAKAQAVPEGFVLLPIKDAKFFSHDGDNYEVHDTLVEAKYEAECAMEHYRERLADQLSDPRSDGNFQNVGYGVVLAKSGYSIDHVVTQADIDKGDYSYEVGTEILSLFLVEAQEQSHEK